MSDTSLSDNREYYHHGPLCDEKTFTELNDRGLKTCLDCAGIFDAHGKSIAVTDPRIMDSDAQIAERIAQEAIRKLRLGK